MGIFQMQTIKQKVWQIINKIFGKSPQYEQEIAYWKRKNNKEVKEALNSLPTTTATAAAATATTTTTMNCI
jgi:hypothetical protein